MDLLKGTQLVNCRTRNQIRKWITTNPVLSYYSTLIFLYRGKKNKQTVALLGLQSKTCYILFLLITK